MRILHWVSEIADDGNGIVHVAVDLACYQADAGHEVAVLSSGGGYDQLLRTHGVHVLVSPHVRPLRRAIRAFASSSRRIASFKPDIVHCHVISASVLGFVLRLFLHFHTVATVHNEYQRGVRLMALAERVVSVSRAVESKMLNRGVPESRSRVVRNGTVGSMRRRTGAAAVLRHPCILALGAVSHRKGSLDLVRVFLGLLDRVPNAHLYFVGNVDQPEAVTLAETAGGGHIHFEGYTSDPGAYLQAADLLVLASRADPYPLVLLEAREAGLPIVAFAVDGVPEALDYGRAGKLVPPCRMDLLDQALGDLLASSEERLRLRQYAQMGLDELSVQRMANDYAMIYQDLLS